MRMLLNDPPLKRLSSSTQLSFVSQTGLPRRSAWILPPTLDLVLGRHLGPAAKVTLSLRGQVHIV